MRICVRIGLGNVLEFAAGCLFEGPNVRILTDRRLLVVKRPAERREFDPGVVTTFVAASEENC